MNIKNFLYTKKSTNKLQWTPERGYASKNVEYPARARKGVQQIFYPMLTEQDSRNHCYQRAFSVILHHPTEIPSKFHEIISVNYKVNVDFKIMIKSSRTDKYLRKFSPHFRKCYFENERKLKFFKIYSKPHCELECNINQTLRKCGCAYIAMPRENLTRICLLDDLECVKQQEESDSLFEGKSMLPCDCYPACNDVKYSFKADATEVTDKVVDTFNE